MSATAKDGLGSRSRAFARLAIVNVGIPKGHCRFYSAAHRSEGFYFRRIVCILETPEMQTAGLSARRSRYLVSSRVTPFLVRSNDQASVGEVAGVAGWAAAVLRREGVASGSQPGHDVGCAALLLGTCHHHGVGGDRCIFHSGNRHDPLPSCGDSYRHGRPRVVARLGRTLRTATPIGPVAPVAPPLAPVEPLGRSRCSGEPEGPPLAVCSPMTGQAST
jgi:hypothetical protein